GDTTEKIAHAKDSGIGTGVTSRSVRVSEPIPVVEGQEFAWRAWFATEDDYQARMEIDLLDDAGDTVETVEGDFHESTGEAGVWDDQSVTIPDGVVSVRPKIHLELVANQQFPGGKLWFGMVRGALADSEGEALAQVDTFFDGDQYEREPLRTNLVRNPSFEESTDTVTATRMSAEVSGDQFLYGEKSMKLTTNGGGAAYIATIEEGVRAGETYTHSMQVFPDEGIGYINVNINFQDSDHSELSNS